MLATWTRAHPFDNGGRWTNPGGDFAAEACITAVSDATTATLLSYDLTDLVETRLISASEPNGWILVDDSASIEIAGEAHETLFPRVSWTEFH